MMKIPNPAKISKTTTTTCGGGGAEIVGSIGDLLTQIFVHLPLKPLFHFKLVSKQWNSIISDPRFQLMRNQQVHNKNRAVGLILQNYRCDLQIKTRVIIPFYDDHRSSSSSKQQPLAQIHNFPNTLRIFHSCNGLLVLKSTGVFAKPEYYVYNPTTNQISDVIVKSRERDRVVGMYLAFDPSKSPYYKVVCVWNKLNNHEKQFEVYSSETSSWEIHGTYNINTDDVDFENGVHWNGAIHWLSLLGKSIYFNPDDHDDEMPARVMPAAPFHHVGRYFIEESCDHLHCVVVVGDYHSLRRIYVYEMRRDYSKWFLKYKVDDYLRNSCYQVRHLYSVVRGNDDEDSLVLGNEKGEIIRYNLVLDTCQTMHHKLASDFYNYQTNSFHYIESPCSV